MTWRMLREYCESEREWNKKQSKIFYFDGVVCNVI